MPAEKTCPTCGKPITENALIGLCPDCLLQAGLGTIDEGSHAVDKSTPFVPPTPEELARYFPELEIIELLGRGGMGAVYKARQKRLERFVALKILPPNVGQAPSFAERFEREAKALAQLHHPNIVTLYDSGQVDGLFYFFMEFVDGVNLRQLLDTGHISPKEALAIVPQICDALQFAHDRGVIHRDIKPENILLNKEGRVKIADFGVAKIVARELPEIPKVSSDAQESGRTEAGKVIGTPQYMAPEQLSHPLDVDNRADIYALGVVFYQMLTGELPAGKFELPSRKVQVDVRLDEVVLRALEKKPELRYQQASAIKTHLETIALNRAPVSSSTPSSATSRQPKRLVLAAGMVVGILLLGALGITIFLRSIRDKSAQGDGTTAQGSLAENHRSVIEAELQQARTVAAQQEREYEAGLGDELELLASKNKVEILEAELTGEPVKIAKARLLAAQRRFVIISNMYKAGVTPLSDYQKAKGEVTIAEAQLREVSPKNEALGATANGATNAVSMPPTTVPAPKTTATVSATPLASTGYPVAPASTTAPPKDLVPGVGRLYHALVYQQTSSTPPKLSPNSYQFIADIANNVFPISGGTVSLPSGASWTTNPVTVVQPANLVGAHFLYVQGFDLKRALLANFPDGNYAYNIERNHPGNPRSSYAVQVPFTGSVDFPPIAPVVTNKTWKSGALVLPPTSAIINFTDYPGATLTWEIVAPSMSAGGWGTSEGSLNLTGLLGYGRTYQVQLRFINHDSSMTFSDPNEPKDYSTRPSWLQSLNSPSRRRKAQITCFHCKGVLPPARQVRYRSSRHPTRPRTEQARKM